MEGISVGSRAITTGTPIKAAGIREAETLARILVAVVRREQVPGGAHFGPGDDIPYDITSVADLDGDIWLRRPSDPASTQRNHWIMRDHDPDEHEGAAAGVYLTPHLLTEYGPVTAIQPKTR
ncbi:hypothetical protein [Streptosporangium roseum]|uniref:Uncharacterized protein n=1 Tax=Streptosporangium roseum (strain ATCC 12428 / DSM 43021 / JCM 3005 / KCTC 9067 / NCIMB 10171 / NRRL 2505 / NI 9100) TaxID=479432 RepID=D2AZT5_STRRD|nr:hypothetical protein [Streptosporangium roseum]ACZ87169.1 hypothetical protein Sros_4275 [Streptosporangium roseum DSM 43021]